jgi:hypothetical protein
MGLKKSILIKSTNCFTTKQLLPNVIFNIANSNVTNSYDFGDILAQYGGFMSTTN